MITKQKPMNNIKMKQKILYVIILMIFYGCTNPLSKQYSSSTYDNDLKYFSENKVEQEDIELIKFFVRNNLSDSSKIVSKTYEQLVEAGKEYKNQLVQGYKDEYINYSDTLDFAIQVELIEKILGLDSDNVFAKNELTVIDQKRYQEIERLKKEYKNTSSTTKKIILCEKVLQLDRKDVSSNKNLVNLYIKKGKYNKGKNLLEKIKTESILPESECLNLTEIFLIRKNIYSLIKITKGKLSHSSQKDLDKNSSILEMMAASEPIWSSSSQITGYATNISKTLTANIRVEVKFTIEIVTTVTAFFITKTNRRTENKTRSIRLNNLAPGKSKSFSASVDLKQEYYEGIGESNAKITNVQISSTLLSPKF
jgi:tetratricopeptide (TPR) repeat protein